MQPRMSAGEPCRCHSACGGHHSENGWHLPDQDCNTQNEDKYTNHCGCCLGEDVCAVPAVLNCFGCCFVSLGGAHLPRELSQLSSSLLS